MYYQYFGLKEAPFSIAVNPRYLFMSARHRDALAHLLYGVGQGGGFILLTGPVGTGKTTINRSVLEQLPDDTDIALVLNPTLNALELLATVCDELGIKYTGDDNLTLKKLTDLLHRFLLDNFSKGRNTVLLIDEAQHLKFEVLEQIRLLTNLETHTKKLLQIILVGQPELTEILAKPELSQLAQRITARYQLQALNLAETGAYIHHRLRVAGLPANQELFKPKVIKHIFKASGGVPRIINVLCDRMLLGTYGKNQTIVDMPTARQASTEVLGEQTNSQPAQRARWPMHSAVATLLILATVSLWQFWPSSTQPLTRSPIVVPPNNTGIASKDTEAITWYLDQPQALSALLSYLNIEGSCQDASHANPNHYLSCDELTADSWQALHSYDRPVLLHLLTPGKMRSYAVLVGIDQRHAQLLIDGQPQRVALEPLGQLWTGNFTLAWHKPAGFDAPIAKGSSGPLVRWLAQQFSHLDQQSTALAEQHFNERLSQRVIIFQRNYALNDDGVVGLKTLLKLNQVLGIETKTLASNRAKRAASTATPTVEGVL